MSHPKSFCRCCKRPVDFAMQGEVAVCPECGERYAPSEITHTIEPEKSGGIWQTIGMVLLFLLAIFLVALAFLFAQCAHELNNI